MQQYEVRIADSDHLVTAAQNLRYKVFFEELKGRSSLASKRLERDFDHFDQFCDHLVVIDRKEKNTSKSVIGTYRLMSRNQAALADGFYTSSEFDVSSILSFPGKILELSRLCIAAGSRNGRIMLLLWKALGRYIVQHQIELLFGCSSFHGTDLEKLKFALSYLFHNHSAPKACFSSSGLRPVAHKLNYVDMNIMPKSKVEQSFSFPSLPPIMKAYIRSGAFFGDGAVVDKIFNTTDVCTVNFLNRISKKYLPKVLAS